MLVGACLRIGSHNLLWLSEGMRCRVQTLHYVDIHGAHAVLCVDVLTAQCHSEPHAKPKLASNMKTQHA